MSRHPRHRRKEKGPGRPSWFFIVLLVLGLVFLAILFARGLSNSGPPMPGPAPAPAQR